MSISESDSTITSRTPKKRKRETNPLEEIEVDISAPEPPSKKARRKAKKAKVKPPIAPSTLEVPKDSTKNAASKSATVYNQDLQKLHTEDGVTETVLLKRSDNGIWIGNLPWIATKDHLLKFLTSNSNITEAMITRIHMPMPKTNSIEAARQRIKPQNKGFAYVDFSDEACVTTAISLSEKLLSGRRVLIKNARSFEGRPKPLKEDGDSKELSDKQTSMPPGKRVFIGNLAFDTTQEELQEHFAKCGEIMETFMATFQDTGKCKGYAWVEFQELEGAVAAVRGWVNVDEKSDEGDSSEHEDDPVKVSKPRKPKIRKWWVNRIRGRPLRMEFAEGKEIRYKKRYAKDGTARKDAMAGDDPTVVDKALKSVDTTTQKIVGFEKLTGQIVKSRGKKTVFA